MTKPKALFIASICLAVLTVAVPAHASSGDLDTGFDGDGIFTWGLANPAEEGASGVAVDPTTGDLVVGNFNYPSNLAVTLVKPAGGVDTAFGGGTVQFGGAATRPTNAVAAQANGKILVAGNDGSHAQNVFLARYRPNGNHDTSFGTNGLVKKTMCGTTAYETNVLVRSDGSIAVVGDCGNGSTHDKLFVLVFTSGGKLDGSFSGDGIVALPIDDDAWISDAMLDGRDRLTLLAHSHVGSKDERVAMVRFTHTGRLDKTFSGDGEAFFNLASGDDDARALIAHGSGSIVAEQAFGTVGSDFLLFAVSEKGTLNKTWSGDGTELIDLQTNDDPRDAVTDAHGNIYIAATFTFGSAEATVLKLNPNGTLDLPFGGSGYAHTGISSSGGWVAMWRGKPTVVGYANFSTDLDDLVARFLA